MSDQRDNGLDQRSDRGERQGTEGNGHGDDQPRGRSADRTDSASGIRPRPATRSRSGSGRVAVLDCIDISGSRLVADADGAVLDDQANQTPRYLYRAEVARDASGRWLVETTAPSLDEPC